MMQVLPVRDVVLFPGMVAPVFVGRLSSRKALAAAMLGEHRQIFVVTQRDPSTEEPQAADLHSVGTICTILQALHMPDGTMKVLLEGQRRMRARSYVESPAFLSADLVVDPGERKDAERIEALRRSALREFEKYVRLHPQLPLELIVGLDTLEDADRMADYMASHSTFTLEARQGLLECFGVVTRLELLIKNLLSEIELLKLEHEFHSKVQQSMSHKQKEHYLREQLEIIQSELGNDNVMKIREQLEKADLPDQVREVVESELARQSSMAPMSPEGTVSKTYVDWLLTLPWNKTVEENADLVHARSVLDSHHYGLKKVKDRLIEYLAVRIMAGEKTRSQILCLVGAPGVGKTSLGQSVAEAMNRPFVSFSLGGMRDEAEIRGHRRTYIGALPGRIIQKMKPAGCNNPVMLLDEVDKLGSDFRGDPASALLEVLDPEQNKNFTDHYLEVPFDLSRVMFITTANVTHTIPAPLLDRMEIIELPSYLLEEKEHIAIDHLIPRLYEQTGLNRSDFSVTAGAVRSVISGYTQEAGVRTLDRQLGTLFRKAATEILNARQKGEKPKKITVRKTDLAPLLGAPRPASTGIPQRPQKGVAIGLAWTRTGGEALVVEAVSMTGAGQLTLTGNLGTVMQESAQAALGCVKSDWKKLCGLAEPEWSKINIHIHVPEGAIPKDGPSAGVTMATALFSALTGRLYRTDCAMTGEISLRGEVLPIGGLREKILAARRLGIKRILVPHSNGPDLADLEDWVVTGVEVIRVKTLEQVLRLALKGNSDDQLESTA